MLTPNCTSGKDVYILATDTLNRWSETVWPLNLVPQGPILVPLLFIMFINDIILEDENTCVENLMYADDSTLCTADESVESINNTLTAQSKPIYQ